MMFNSLKYLFRLLGFPGVIATIRGKVIKNTVFLKVERSDVKYPFSLRMSTSDVPTYEQIFFKEDYKFQVSEEPKIIVDAGANIGLTSIYFANKFKNAKIIAIEPELSNFELLKKNTELYKNITPVFGALWNENKEINMIDSGLGKWGYMSQDISGSNDSSSNQCNIVVGMTIEHVMEAHEIDRIDILKIDIEGAEKEVFEAPQLWIDKVDTLIVELHERMKIGCNRSFYNATNDFEVEWLHGESVYLSKNAESLVRLPY